jgi:hypothetical protein
MALTVPYAEAAVLTEPCNFPEKGCNLAEIAFQLIPVAAAICG